MPVQKAIYIKMLRMIPQILITTMYLIHFILGWSLMTMALKLTTVHLFQATAKNSGLRDRTVLANMAPAVLWGLQKVLCFGMMRILRVSVKLLELYQEESMTAIHAFIIAVVVMVP